MGRKKKKKRHKPDPGYYRIKRSRKGRAHIKNCNTGYYEGRYPWMNVHHIVPIASVQDSYIYDQLKNYTNFHIVKKCLLYTKWDINAGHNCIGLVTKLGIYGLNPKNWSRPPLPCHQYDHNSYDDTVRKDLKKMVWNPALTKAKKCIIKYQDIKEELEERSDYWRKFLKKRGRKKKGTEYCWRNRYKIEDWYYPFSMGPQKPKPRHPPATLEDFSKDLKKAMKNLFGRLRK